MSIMDAFDRPKWMDRLAPRLLLSVVPVPLGTALAGFIGYDSCWGSDSLFCIYYWYPPFIDILFALLVLAPLITTWRFATIRIIALIAVSVSVHLLAVGQLVNTRGSLEIPGLDSIFLNVVPIAMVASLVMAGLSVLIAGASVNRRLLIYAVVAALPAAGVFLVLDAWEPSQVVYDYLGISGPTWLVWHASLCAAMFLGLKQRSEDEIVAG